MNEDKQPIPAEPKDTCTMVTRTPVTVEQFYSLPDEPCRRVLVRGELWTMAAAGAKHGLVASRLDRLIGNFVEANHLGAVFGAETGFVLARDPDTVLAPDVAFVRADRIPQEGVPEDFWAIAPDLVAEIVSPGDRPRRVATKVETWLAADVRLVWVLHPRHRTVAIHTPDTAPVTLGDDGILDGGSVLPGFACPVRDLWS